MSHYYHGLTFGERDRLCPSPVEISRNDVASTSGLIDDVMKKYFCQKARQGSSCSLFSDRRGSVYSMDKRLMYWKRIIEDRKRIACRIQKVTGKRLSHILYNQLEEHRNVQSVKRLMDLNQRLDPSKIINRRLNHIQDPSIFETIPLPERLQAANLEIVGTPKISQAEQWIHHCTACSNSFLTSSFLQKKIKAEQPDILNILEFYPDIDCLQVVGQRIHKHSQLLAVHVSDFELSAISSASNLESWERVEFPEYCIQIGDTVLRTDVKTTKSLGFNLVFKCKPYERVTQTLCCVKSIGRKPVYLVLHKIKTKATDFLQLGKLGFAFNQNTFRMTYGETEKIEVSFMFDQRGVLREQWSLNIIPNFFEHTSKILINLYAECYIPEDYFKNIVCDVLDSVLCTVVPGSCGQRKKVIQTEEEVFDKENPCFKCEPEDLLKFKEIYRQIKKKSHPTAWDMNLQTIKQLIEGIDDYTQRSKYLEEFMKIIREMRRRHPDCDSNIRVLLARNLILTVLDRWEAKAEKIIYSIARTDIDVLVIRMPFDFIIEQLKLCKTVEEKRKTFQHNALYVQMYCAFCDLAEDIVSFMENCLLLSVY